MMHGEFDQRMYQFAETHGMNFEYIAGGDGVGEHYGAWSETRSAVLATRDGDTWVAVLPTPNYPLTDPVNELRVMIRILLSEVA